MPRNGSGTMSVTNSFSSGATISSSPMNANFTDVASEITNSLPRDGQAGMTGQLKAAAGSVSAPSVTFSSDTDTGFYRKSANTIGAVSGGSEVAELGSSGWSDANGVAIVGMPTGVILPYGASTAPTGWVRPNGLTIGNASSGATERANADTSDLFSFLWTNYADSVCAVSSGRGSTAAADYAANKTITLPDLRGRSFFGMDDMGNSAAGRLGDVITSSNGASGGTETHTLDETELPAHTHSMSAHTHSVSITTGTESQNHQHAYSGTTSADGSHSHTYNEPSFTASRANGGSSTATDISTGTTSTIANHSHTYSGTSNSQSVNHTHSVSGTTASGGDTATGSIGSSAAHSNMPPAFVGGWIMKL